VESKWWSKRVRERELWVVRVLVVECWAVFGFTAVQERWSNVGFLGILWWKVLGIVVEHQSKCSGGISGRAN
jgi:hypothetical protein